ncbi:hypothetical protein COI81_01930 [Bacillus cereus]|nr:hypothetical protein COI81_01930 [Bacillus cereus]PGS22169.1 hypothetical protein COC55_22940 [Bacillus cereus]
MNSFKGSITFYAEWIVPRIPSTPEDTTASVVVWIGIGGGGGGYLRDQPAIRNVIQIGTGANYLLGDPNYFAWWETYGMPTDKGEANPIDSNQYPIYPGDKIEASINMQNSQGIWKMTLNNVTQKWPTAYVNTVNYTGDQTTAEFIVEAPQIKDNNGNLIPKPLPNYGKVTFDNCRVNGQNANFDFGDIGDPKNPQKKYQELADQIFLEMLLMETGFSLPMGIYIQALQPHLYC